MAYTPISLTPRTRDQILSFLSRTSRGTHLFTRVPELLKLIPSFDHICAWTDDDSELVSVACYLHFPQHKSAELWLLPWGAAPDLVEHMLAWLKERLPASPVTVEVPLPQTASLLGQHLAARGWSYAYTVEGMTRAAAPRLAMPQPPALPAGAQWQAYDEALFAAYYETLEQAFKQRPGITIPSREEQRKRCRAFGPKLQLLVKDGVVLAFVRVEVHPDRSGELASLARHPQYRGMGLGQAAVHQGIKQAYALGAQRALSLEVTLGNAEALRLYEGFGFRRDQAMDTWQIAWDPASQRLRPLPASKPQA